jgi:leader peptidase (prepilin peptidase)/N-methyltransferase
VEILAINFLIFILGLCLGSFLNVLIYRLPHSLPITGRSFCPKCKKKISWQDNIPILSFIFLHGRCRFCHSPISIQYPLVELTTGIVTVFMVFHLRGVPQAQHHLGGVLSQLVVVYALIVIFVSDLRYQIIPDKIVYPATLLTLFYQPLHLRGVPQAQHHLGGVLLTGLAAAGFFFFLFWITHGRGMGLGDVKLAALMGFFLGFPKIIVALYLAFLTGALVGVILVLIGKKRFGEHISFGPFLTGATIVSLFYGEVIWQKLIAVLL